MHPIGSCITMSTNTNPSTKLGGTWTLINKQYSVISSNSESVNFLKQNTTNVTTTKNYVFRNGNTIVLEFRFTPKSTITLQDDTVILGTLNTDVLGLTSFGATRYFLLAGDSAEGIAQCKLDYTTNEISILDTVGTQGKTGLTAGYLLSGQLVTVVKPEFMLDDACNQFIFKRTA